MVGRLAQVGRASLGAEVRPEPLDDLIAQERPAIRESQQRDELVRSARRPVAHSDLPVVKDDPELSEHLDAHVVGPCLHGAPSS